MSEERDEELVTKLARLEKIRARAREQVVRDAPPPDLVIQTAVDITDEPLESAFGGRLVRSAFQLMVGPGESGKGMCSSDIVARFTTGEPFPNDSLVWRKPMSVIVCVTEDSAPRVKARFSAAGADLNLIFFIAGPPALRGGLVVPSPIAFDSDAGAMLSRIKSKNAGALYLETTVEHLGDREGRKVWSTNNEMEVRRAMAPLVALCREAKLFGWGVMHPRKSLDGGIEDSISGSAAFRNVGRSILHVYRDPEDKDEHSPWRLLVATKSNYMHMRPPTLRFRIEPWDKDKREGRVVWGIAGKSLIDSRGAEHIWRQMKDKLVKRKDYVILDAEKELMKFLEKGPKTMDEIKKMSEDKDIPWRTIETAKQNLGIESLREGFPGRVTSWRIPVGPDAI